MLPLAPIFTHARLATASAGRYLMVEAVGRGPPSGQRVRKPGSVTEVATMLSTTAVARTGTVWPPNVLVTSTEIWPPGVSVLLGPVRFGAGRVSAIRVGTSARNPPPP